MRLRALLISVVTVVAWLAVVGPSGSPALAQARRSPCAPGGPAANGQYPPSACGLAIGRNRARPGERLVVSGAGFRPNSTVALEFRSTPVSLGSATGGADGAFSARVVIPADATPGVHNIVATGTDDAGQAMELASTVTVLAPSSRVLARLVTRGGRPRVAGGGLSRTGGGLPRTGESSTLAGGVAGVVLVGVGSVALLLGRRRRNA